MGSDISFLIPYIPSIAKLKFKDTIAIRGELIISLESLGNDDIINKFLSCGGYHVKIKTNNMYICCFLRTKIYKHILLSLPSHDNKHRNYLELYQNNLLGDILPYLHKYSADVVRRINIAIKILSKEILKKGIYHHY